MRCIIHIHKTIFKIQSYNVQPYNFKPLPHKDIFSDNTRYHKQNNQYIVQMILLLLHCLEHLSTQSISKCRKGKFCWVLNSVMAIFINLQITTSILKAKSLVCFQMIVSDTKACHTLSKISRIFQTECRNQFININILFSFNSIQKTTNLCLVSQTIFTHSVFSHSI